LFAVLLTANFQGNAEAEFSALSELQPGRPSWAMEMWTGWFDHWLATPHESRPKESMHTLIYQMKKICITRRTWTMLSYIRHIPIVSVWWTSLTSFFSPGWGS
jgi:hypothetical protein